MITITVLENSTESVELIDPIDCFGAEYGEVYQQYSSGKPQNEYLIGAGHCESPISIWYDNDEHGEYRISSESKKDLKLFSSHIKYRLLPNAKVTITLEV